MRIFAEFRPFLKQNRASPPWKASQFAQVEYFPLISEPVSVRTHRRSFDDEADRENVILRKVNIPRHCPQSSYSLENCLCSRDTAMAYRKLDPCRQINGTSVFAADPDHSCSMRSQEQAERGDKDTKARTVIGALVFSRLEREDPVYITRGRSAGGPITGIRGCALTIHEHQI